MLPIWVCREKKADQVESQRIFELRMYEPFQWIWFHEVLPNDRIFFFFRNCFFVFCYLWCDFFASLECLDINGYHFQVVLILVFCVWPAQIYFFSSFGREYKGNKNVFPNISFVNAGERDREKKTFIVHINGIWLLWHMNSIMRKINVTQEEEDWRERKKKLSVSMWLKINISWEGLWPLCYT